MGSDEVYFNAMLARDHRFDGKFFVGVKTTGIYCRPICPAKPRRENVEFFHSSHEAERAGYRPCLRCRPESAPLSAAWIGKSAVVRRAIRALFSQDELNFNEDHFAALFGVSSRHLRRLFKEEIGKTPKQLYFENRLNLSRKLLVETGLSVSEVVYASGFKSIRRFNDAFKQRFKKTPSEVRRKKSALESGLSISLSYRPPFDFEGLLKSYDAHRMGSLEWIEDEKYHRIVAHNGESGLIVVSNCMQKSHLNVEINFPDHAMIHFFVSQVRAMFDLNSDPIVIANALEKSKKMKSLLKKYPGIRLTSGWNGFEVAISIILGQLVSVKMGQSLVRDLIENVGSESNYLVKGSPVKLFPTPGQLSEADLGFLKTSKARKSSLIEFAKKILNEEISLEPTQDVDDFIRRVKEVKGIGDWTAQYMALKVLRDTDGFPRTDLVIKRALVGYSKQEIEQMRPWRGYAASLFWRDSVDTLTKIQRGKK